ASRCWLTLVSDASFFLGRQTELEKVGLVVYPDLTDNSRAGKSGTIVSFHHGERRRRYGTEPVLLPTPTGRSRVELPHDACLVARPSQGRTSQDLQAG